LAYYENVLIARQDLSATQVEGIVENLEGVIKENGGSVEKKEFWGLRSLAYKIKKNRKGHYVLMNIDAPAPAVHEMERLMRLNEDILRYQTIRVDELEEGPSIILQNKDRDDRPRRPRRDDFDKPADSNPETAEDNASTGAEA